MKKVYTANSVQEAHIIKQVLRQETIPVEIHGVPLAGAIGQLPPFETNPSIWVPEELAARAIKVIKDSQLAENNKDFVDWQCDCCQEKNEGQFYICWNCGTEHSESKE